MSVARIFGKCRYHRHRVRLSIQEPGEFPQSIVFLHLASRNRVERSQERVAPESRRVAGIDLGSGAKGTDRRRFGRDGARALGPLPQHARGASENPGCLSPSIGGSFYSRAFGQANCPPGPGPGRNGAQPHFQRQTNSPRSVGGVTWQRFTASWKTRERRRACRPVKFRGGFRSGEINTGIVPKLRNREWILWIDGNTFQSVDLVLPGQKAEFCLMLIQVLWLCFA